MRKGLKIILFRWKRPGLAALLTRFYLSLSEIRKGCHDYMSWRCVSGNFLSAA
jgi:hypothetical protein